MMMIVGRFLLRFLLVPLGLMVAGTVANIVLLVAHWNEFATLVDSGAHPAGTFALDAITLAWGMLALTSVASLMMLSPIILGVVISEAFALRSWLFHALNGGLSMWLGTTILFAYRSDAEAVFESQLEIVAAGLAAGFAYWAIAGWNAGFWKPVFAPSTAARTR